MKEISNDNKTKKIGKPSVYNGFQAFSFLCIKKHIMSELFVSKTTVYLIDRIEFKEQSSNKQLKCKNIIEENNGCIN